MKTRHSLLLSVLSAIGFGGISLAAQTILFQETFEYDSPTPLNEAGGGPWTTASLGGGTWSVMEDVENIFGYGTGNRFLRVQSATNLNLTANFEGAAVVTASFDFIGRVRPEDGNRWLNANLQVGGARAHATSLRMLTARIRTEAAGHETWPEGYSGPYNPSYGENDIPIRFDTLLNNSFSPVEYVGPDGQDYILAAAGATNAYAAVWVYNYNTAEWSNPLPQYVFAPQPGAIEGLVNRLFLQLDSGSGILRSFDIDNIFVFEGAHIGLPFPIDAGPSDMGLRASIHAGSVELSWNASIDSWYQVQYRTDLNGGGWINLGDQIYPAEEGVQVFQDPESISANEQRYYRVQRTLW
jgi:hypothetical protein